jgi:ABC-2 type transport system permease protein
MSTEQLPSQLLGRPIKGPSALGSDPQRFWQLTRALAVTEFKLRFFGSVLGYLWQLMRPLLVFGVLYAVFTNVVKLGSGVKFYPVALLLGVVLYTFFSEATSGSVTSIIDRENLVRKIEFPRLAVPLATVLTALFNLALNVTVVLIFLLASGGRVRWTWLELPVLLILLAALATGMAMLLSALYVRYRDVRPIWDVLVLILFYASPIFYPIERVHNLTLRHALMFNPFAAIIQQARYAVIDPSHLSAGSAIGGNTRLLIPVAVAVAILAVGYRYFDHEAPRIAERL